MRPESSRSARPSPPPQPSPTIRCRCSASLSGHRSGARPELRNTAEEDIVSSSGSTRCGARQLGANTKMPGGWNLWLPPSPRRRRIRKLPLLLQSPCLPSRAGSSTSARTRALPRHPRPRRCLLPSSAGGPAAAKPPTPPLPRAAAAKTKLCRGAISTGSFASRAQSISTADARKRLFEELLWEHRDLAEAHSHCQAVPEAFIEALKTQLSTLQAEKEQLIRDHRKALDTQEIVSRGLKDQVIQAGLRHDKELKDAKAAAEAKLNELLEDSTNSSAVLRAELEEESKARKAAEDGSPS
ncbi:hypothetical protein QYE76_032188 [Lolium multiflorum]|uniref:Uncharacterized protein n=1 Tax=Lolium multiflorum TaxID=4521 RepID=A0AAD8QU98_LOLMU|nr:hypothetical protein QYE76_032188 [Lolium multiflorum]